MTTLSIIQPSKRRLVVSLPKVEVVLIILLMKLLVNAKSSIKLSKVQYQLHNLLNQFLPLKLSNQRQPHRLSNQHQFNKNNQFLLYKRHLYPQYNQLLQFKRHQCLQFKNKSLLQLLLLHIFHQILNLLQLQSQSLPTQLLHQYLNQLLLRLQLQWKFQHQQYQNLKHNQTQQVNQNPSIPKNQLQTLNKLWLVKPFKVLFKCTKLNKINSQN